MLLSVYTWDSGRLEALNVLAKMERLNRKIVNWDGVFTWSNSKEQRAAVELMERIRS